MADNEFDLEYEHDQEGDSPLVKDLRRQLRAANKRAKEAETKATALESEKSQQTISSLLVDRKLDPGVAQFVPSDVKDAAALDTWLKGPGALFARLTAGEQPTEQEAEQKPKPKEDPAPTPDLPPEIKALYEQLAATQSAAAQEQRLVGEAKALAELEKLAADAPGLDKDEFYARLQNIPLG